MAEQRTPVVRIYPKDLAISGIFAAIGSEGIGAYFLLLAAACNEEPPGTLPDDPAALMAMARINQPAWSRIERFLMACFRRGEDGRLQVIPIDGVVGLRWLSGNIKQSRRLYNRRARRLAAARVLGCHSEKEWQEILSLCFGVCPRCEKRAQLTKDHIVPISIGGSDAAANLQPLCRSCNSAKKHETVDWLTVRGWR